jgi:hypothetical protein
LSQQTEQNRQPGRLFQALSLTRSIEEMDLDQDSEVQVRLQVQAHLVQEEFPH